MMLFEHFIITRFNIPTFIPKVDGHSASSACDEEYLKYRFDLFENYCFPSIKNQTCQNFKWLILMDNNTPERFKQRLQELHVDYENLIPCYLNLDDYPRPYPKEYIQLYDEYARVAKLPSYSNIHEDPKREIQHIITPLFVRDCILKLSKGKPEYYMTTRIDNDDAFHKDFVSIVQKRVIENPEAIVLDYPYTYKFILYKKVVYRYELKNNHFISVVEKSSDNIQSAIYWNHLYVDHFMKVEHNYMEPLQVELIHGNNVVNDFTEMSIPGFAYSLTHFNKKTFGYKNAPQSVYNYFRIIISLCKKSLIALFKDFHSYRTRYLALPQHRKEAIVMIDGSRTHGGLTDRFRHILSIYSYCKEQNIPFYINYTYPCDLTKILVPNMYDWRIKSSRITSVWYDYKELNLDVSCNKACNLYNEEHIKILNDNLLSESKVQYHIYGNSYFAEGKYKVLFDELFKPSATLMEKLIKIKENLPNEYDSVTLRFQNLLGGFNEGTYPELKEDEKEKLIQKCINKIEELYRSQYFSTDKILVTSDSKIFIERVRSLVYVATIPGDMEHMDYTNSSDIDMNCKSFIDLYMLKDAKHLTLLLTGDMYNSGFPKFAAELGGKTVNHILF